ncbi:hypothetical protein J7E50_23495 [Pedobacter sp. ISL-68]|uniref:hypothetical protein n=1 Tax=unclassified Pedobacter TaxID=2628915 RepID=UPI001BE5803F|nr:MULTISPECIES: hypothetical protein [unclassified Pedobacter]MBT2564385.1 hypothetical protein [Pedobacter sp. ISL-64]MBT2593205.1 hypothetical protein [Pedobacter sp. ISL-68]
MWSDRYNYYNIKSDREYSQKVETETAIGVLLQTGNFVQDDNKTLSNADHFPWINITLVETKDGDFVSSTKKIDLINLIAIVCAKGTDIDQIYTNALLEVAEKLNWKPYLEADDEGNQDVIINPLLNKT